jgi:hypothetical protein
VFAFCCEGETGRAGPRESGRILEQRLHGRKAIVESGGDSQFSIAIFVYNCGLLNGSAQTL